MWWMNSFKYDFLFIEDYMKNVNDLSFFYTDYPGLILLNKAEYLLIILPPHSPSAKAASFPEGSINPWSI